LARLEKDFKTNPPFKAEPEMALLFFCPETGKRRTKELNIPFPCVTLPRSTPEGAMSQ
jgi:hypothetical protein